MMNSTPNQTNTIQFLLNGKKVSISDADPTQSVLYYLRENKKLMGTKEGCAEGDCGACTVVIGELVDDKTELKTVNACIQFLPTLDGKALFTVENLRQKDGSLHPVQQSMVDHNGSQCGFCTPGFIMSLWNVYNQHQDNLAQYQDHYLPHQSTGLHLILRQQSHSLLKDTHHPLHNHNQYNQLPC